jgi:hypothetical protein
MSHTNVVRVRALSLAVATAVATAVLVSPAKAQPPAQGPPPASPNAANEMVTALFTGAVGAEVNETVAAKNKQLTGFAKNGSISWSGDALTPYMIPTYYNDQPNQFYADIPYNLAYTYSIGPFSLTISQFTDIQVYCQGWQTPGQGKLAINAVLQPAYFDQDQFSVIADALQIPQLVQGEISQTLASMPSGTFSIPLGGQPCASLGLITNAQSLGDDAVVFDSPVTRPPQPIGIGTPSPNISVRVTQVTRLANGGEYQAIETPYLTLWAFYSKIELNLPAMVEGQTYNPPADAVVETPVPASNGELVLIAAMTYDGISKEDCTWAAFGQNSYFGRGTQNLITPKSWLELLGHRAVAITANGYQVTLQISVPELAGNL